MPSPQPLSLCAGRGASASRAEEREQAGIARAYRFSDTDIVARNWDELRDNVQAARELRTRQTAAEVVLWEALRGRRLDDLKFRGQHPVGPFVLDFCCPDRLLGIELDGGIHTAIEQREQDAERERLLDAADYRVLHFPNEAVTSDLASVLETIRAAAADRPQLPPQRVPRTATS